MLNGPILALDADEDVYAVVTYQLLGTHSDLFVIDNSTGKSHAAGLQANPMVGLAQAWV